MWVDCRVQHGVCFINRAPVQENERRKRLDGVEGEAELVKRQREVEGRA